MIIREENEYFILIEQHHHAKIAASIIKQSYADILCKDSKFNSVLYAVEQHDRGWRLFDKQPFWNDKKKAPFSFIDFPIKPKSVIYTQGVDEVEVIDTYAAILCSAHYSIFMDRSEDKEAKQFVIEEKQRRARLIKELDDFSEERFAAHLSILQFADNVSLYVCLHSPGIKKRDEHSFFKNGIPAPSFIPYTGAKMIQANWKDEQTISLVGLPKVEVFSITVKQKCLTKDIIHEKGLMEAYELATRQEKTICFQFS